MCHFSWTLESSFHRMTASRIAETIFGLFPVVEHDGAELSSQQNKLTILPSEKTFSKSYPDNLDRFRSTNNIRGFFEA